MLLWKSLKPSVVALLLEALARRRGEQAAQKPARPIEPVSPAGDGRE